LSPESISLYSPCCCYYYYDYYHYHCYPNLVNILSSSWIDITHNRSDPMFPELSAAQVKALMGKLMGTHGKVIITWNPRDKLPEAGA
ncbi:MAG TPA: hypothetical protein VIR31_06630, partial [Nitrososphaeraceae archaeon]